jgi:hypothetical protein
MTRVCATLLCLFVVTSTGFAKNRHCMLRVHAQANPSDTESFSTSVKAQLSGKQVAIERVARITEWEVRAFTPYQSSNGTFGVLLELDEHGRILLDELSVERKGQFIFVFINGRPITELQIDRRVSDGQLYIPSGLTVADIALMKKDWKLMGGKRKR